jgi:transketolase
MRYFAKDPAHVANDRFILSKGHAAPILYAAWERAGFMTKDQLMTLRYSFISVQYLLTKKFNLI